MQGEVGPVISAASRDHIVGCIDKAQAAGHEVLVDGRGWAKRQPGTWVGPTVIVKGREGNGGATEESEEIFGPVLMVVKVCLFCGEFTAIGRREGPGGVGGVGGGFVGCTQQAPLRPK